MPHGASRQDIMRQTVFLTTHARLNGKSCLRLTENEYVATSSFLFLRQLDNTSWRPATQ